MHAIVKRVLFPQIPIFLPHFVLLCMYTILWSFDRVNAIEKFVLTLIAMCRKTRQHHETNLTSLRRLRSGSKVIKNLFTCISLICPFDFISWIYPRCFTSCVFFFPPKKRAVPQSREGLLLFIFCLKIESNLFFLIFSFYFFF